MIEYQCIEITCVILLLDMIRLVIPTEYSPILSDIVRPSQTRMICASFSDIVPAVSDTLAFGWQITSANRIVEHLATGSLDVHCVVPFGTVCDQRSYAEHSPPHSAGEYNEAVDAKASRRFHRAGSVSSSFGIEQHPPDSIH